jgi:hypothetical protein
MLVSGRAVKHAVVWTDNSLPPNRGSGYGALHPPYPRISVALYKFVEMVYNGGYETLMAGLIFIC